MLRRYTFKLYPNAAQAAALREQARMCAVLWNALLEMRETHYRRAKQRGDKKTSLTAFDQGKDITALNATAKVDPALAEWRAMPRGTQERVADMLDLAMKAFFKRAKGGAGAASGYPRYKSTLRAENIPMREPVKSGWKFRAHSAHVGNDEPRASGEEEARSGSTWRLTLRGVPGAIKARGKFPVAPEALKTADVKFHDDAWWFSVCVDIERARKAGAQKLTVELDLIDEFARVKLANGRCAPGLNDPFSNGRKGEFHPQSSGLQGSPCGDSANAGEAQGDRRMVVEAAACGDSANAGEAQGCLQRIVDGLACGDSANAGEAQAASRLPRHCRACGDSANAGEAQEGARAGRPWTPCGDSANAGEAQEGARAGRPWTPCGDSANAGEAQDRPCAPPRARPCGDSANAGEAQARLPTAVLRSSCGDAANAGEKQVVLADRIQSARDRRYKRGSIRWRREKHRIARIKARQARRTKEALHRWSTEIVRRASELHVIAPPVKDATKTGRGNERFHGAEVATIAALNRRVLSMAPASAIQMLEYKAAEAGVSCLVERRADHQIAAGGDLRAAAIDARRAKRVTKRKQKILEAAE